VNNNKHKLIPPFHKKRPATSKLDVMYEPLWALREIFSDIWPWSTIYNGQDMLRKKLDNAVWTYQVEVKKAVEEKAENVSRNGMISFRHLRLLIGSFCRLSLLTALRTSQGYHVGTFPLGCKDRHLPLLSGDLQGHHHAGIQQDRRSGV
jgi:hypothetical protein